MVQMIAMNGGKSKMTGKNNWFEDFVSRCIAAGIDPDGLLLSVGHSEKEITAYKRGKKVGPSDRVLLESALTDWGTEPDPEEDEPEETVEAPAPDPPNPPLICEGDKIRCPYLTYTGRKGFCMMPRCMYTIIREEDVNDQTRADAGAQPAEREERAKTAEG